MDYTTLEALKGSIRKWEKIAKGSTANRGPLDCPLCKLFNNNKNSDDNCVGCPVSIRSGARYCENTPYMAFFDATACSGVGLLGARATTPKKKRLALAEVEFLRSLLPAKKV